MEILHGEEGLARIDVGEDEAAKQRAAEALRPAGPASLNFYAES